MTVIYFLHLKLFIIPDVDVSAISADGMAVHKCQVGLERIAVNMENQFAIFINFLTELAFSLIVGVKYQFVFINRFTASASEHPG